MNKTNAIATIAATAALTSLALVPAFAQQTNHRPGQMQPGQMMPGAMNKGGMMGQMATKGRAMKMDMKM